MVQRLSMVPNTFPTIYIAKNTQELNICLKLVLSVKPQEND